MYIYPVAILSLSDTMHGNWGGYWTTRGCHRRLCVLSFPFWRHLRDRELSIPRVGVSASCPVTTGATNPFVPLEHAPGNSANLSNVACQELDRSSAGEVLFWLVTRQ